MKLKGNIYIYIYTRKTGFFDWMDCDMDSISCLEKSLANVATPNGRDDFRLFLLVSTIPSRCMSETANWNVDSETGSLESMGSDVDISGLNNGSGDPPCAAPKCSELEETANPEVNTSASELGNFDFMDSESESTPCSVDATTSSGRRDPPSAAPSGYTGSKLRETMNLKASTLARSGKSSTNVTSDASLVDTQVSERLYQLAEIIGASKTIPDTLGLWPLVVNAAPHDVKDMSEGLLTPMIKDTELEEAAYDEDFLLVRAVTTGWKYYEEGVCDVGERRDGPGYTDRLDSNDTGGLRSGGLPVPTGHLCRMWNGQWCTLMTASHPCFLVPQRSPSHCPCTHIIHTGTLLSPFDGWLTSHGLCYKRMDARLNTETTTLQEIYTFCSSIYYLSTDA